MFGFLKKKKEGSSFGDLDVPPPPPPLFEQHDAKNPFTPPPVEPSDNLPRPTMDHEEDMPLPESEVEKPELPDFMDDKPLDIHIPEPERADAPPSYEPIQPSPMMPPPMPPAPRPEYKAPEPRSAPASPVIRVAPQVPLRTSRPPVVHTRPPMPAIEHVFAPDPTVHQGSSIFINVEEYKSILDAAGGMRNGLKGCEDALFKITELQSKYEVETQKWRRLMEDVQRKFVLVDNKLFG